MKFKLRNLLLSAAGLLLAGGVAAQDINVDYKKYPDAKPFAGRDGVKGSPSSKSAAAGTARSAVYGKTRPDHVNNALTKYYPPVFNQDGGSCGSAAAVGYSMTYDMNAYRNTDASYPENQLPTHFTWLHTYSGIDKYDIMNRHGVPNVTDYGGRTYSALFGNQDTESSWYGFMQGYDKWYRAMFNRTLGGDTFCSQSQATEVGREELKQWLWNHWGDESFYAGGLSGIGVASGGQWGQIPSTATNREIGVAGMYCVSSWGKNYDHALTIVGYDDRIEFDLDSNGVYGEEGKDEKGAWIICNSWGAGWCNKGFIYCPYKFSVAIGTNVLPWNSGHYTWRKDYEPKRVLKIVMDYSRRSELCFSAGVATDTSAVEPEAVEVMPFFNYAGDGKKLSPAPEVPMLGKWRYTFNYEPIEFGYDVTDLSENCDMSKPLKYFFVIKSRATAVGEGHIYKVSLMDYSVEAEGLEIPARIDTVAVLNNGKTTIVSVTVAGRQVYAPVNASLSGNKLTWNAPKPSSYDIARYYIYKGNEKVAEVPNFSHSYTVDDENATYYVATAYGYKDYMLVSQKSQPARNSAVYSPEGNNRTLKLSNASVVVPDVMTEKLSQATIEFWIKPNSLGSSCDQIGGKWGSFLLGFNKSGQILCGWNTSNRIGTASNTIKVGKWYHVAVVIDNNVITVYVNGMKKGSMTSASFSGLPAMDQFNIGTADGLMDAEIDEFRIWSGARTQREVFTNMRTDIGCPSAQPELLVYYPMTTYEADGALYLKDLASGHDALLENATSADDETLLTGANVQNTVGFACQEDVIYVGEPVQFKSESSLNTVKWDWSVKDLADGRSSVVNPYFTFSKAGSYEITLKVEDKNGKTAEFTGTVTVVNPEAPKADFDIAVDTLAEGEMFSLANKSQGANCVCKWSLPGADNEEINSVNALVSYSNTGVYPITLTVTNAGGTDQMTKYVTVSHTVPAVAFSVDPNFIYLGETTYLIDNTRHGPDSWKWTVTNGKHTTIVNGQNSSFTPKHPGIYSVTLEAGNDVGTATKTEEQKFIVANADSRNALNFTGGQQLVSVSDIFAEGTKAFTIEWWMNPSQMTGALNMSTSNGQIAITTDYEGNMTVEVGGKSCSSGNGYVVAGEWQHYALTFTFGTVKFYRNGELITTSSSRIGTSTKNWGKLIIAGGENSFGGQLDELRIWSKCQSLSVMKGFINAPLNNPADLVGSNGLVAYYDFNQNGGSVVDRSGNGNDLNRIGFGPDGDAWGLSKGVFTLDFDTTSPEQEELDGDGLTHIYDAVKAGKEGKYSGVSGAIRLVIDKKENVRIYNVAGQCVLNDFVEGVHYIPFEPGVYVVNGVKVMVR